MSESVTDRHVLSAPYVRAAGDRLRDAIVVRPNVGIDRLAPIHGEPSAIGERALEQHAILVRTLTDRGVRVTTIEMPGDTGYATFVADGAVLLETGAIIMRPSRLERRKEAGILEAALAEAGVPIIGRIDAPGVLDGGDVEIGAGVAYVGVPTGTAPMRSNVLGRRQFESIVAPLGLRVVELPVQAQMPRLRSVFSVVDTDVIVAAPDYVDVVPIGNTATIVAIARGEQFAAGVLAMGPRKVLANLRFREGLQTMRKAKIEVEAIDLWEFGKVGAGPGALALAIKRG